MNKEQINKAVAKMNEEVVFDPEKHQYHRKSDGVLLQGTSTVSNIIPKPWLSAWGSKEVVKAMGFSDYGETEKAQEMLDKIKGMDLKQYLAFLKFIKGSAFRKSKDAMADGTKGHKILEDRIKAKIAGTELPALPDGLLGRACLQFVEWENKNVKEWLLSEVLVASPDQFYAGTMDGLALMKDDKLAVIDFKFATHISSEVKLQTAGYQQCFENQGIKIDERIVIRLPKTLERETYNKKTFTYSMIPNNLEVKIYDKSYEADRDAFLHSLPLKRWINLEEKKSY